MRLINAVGTGQQGSSTWNAGCTATEQPGDAVYVLSAGQVRQARADDVAKARVVGVVTAKPTATTCVVASGGAVPIAGLTAGSRHFLSATQAGRVVDSEPASGSWVVSLGMAKDATTLVVEIEEPELKG